MTLFETEAKRIQREAQEEAAEIYAPHQERCRLVIATVLEIRSQLDSNGIVHTPDSLVKLTELAMRTILVAR